MIAWIWRGRTRAEQADAYEAYNDEEGIRPLAEKAAGLQTFREDRGRESERVTIASRDRLEAMAAFSGSDDPTAVHRLSRDEEFLIELARAVQILRLLSSQGRIG